MQVGVPQGGHHFGKRLTILLLSAALMFRSQVWYSLPGRCPLTPLVAKKGCTALPGGNCQRPGREWKILVDGIYRISIPMEHGQIEDIIKYIYIYMDMIYS